MEKKNIAANLQVAITEAFGREPMTEASLEQYGYILEEFVGTVLEDVLKENEELAEINYQLLLDKIFDKYTAGLVSTQKEKLRSLLANLDLDPDNPFDDYEQKLRDLKDGLYPPYALPRGTMGWEEANAAGQIALKEGPTKGEHATARDILSKGTLPDVWVD